MKYFKNIEIIFKNIINTLLSGFNRKKTHENYRKGMTLYNKRKFAESIEYFKYLIENKTISDSMEYDLARFYYSQAHRNLGIIEFYKGNNEQALNYFKTALRFNPEHNDLHYFIGICLNNTGNFKDAIKAFKKFQSIDPDNIPNKLKMAVMFYNLGMWENAEKIQKEILAKNPGYADVHYYLGLSLICQGKVEESIESFNHALNINPSYINAKLKLGIAQACIGKFNDAFINLNTIIKTHPDYADIYYFIGLIKYEINEIQSAMEYFNKAIALNSNFVKAKLKLIMCCCKTGKIRKAKKLIKEFILLYPDYEKLEKLLSIEKQINKAIKFSTDTGENILNNEILNNYDNIFGKKGLSPELYNEFHRDLHIIPSFSEIIALFTNFKYAQKEPEISKVIIPLISEHIHKNPTYPDLYNCLGLQYLLINEPEKAETAFIRAVELNHKYIAARINLLKTLHQNGKYEEAQKHGKILLSAGVCFPDVFNTIAENMFALKQYDDALESAEKVLQIRPSLKNIHLLIARIYGKQKKYDLAIQELDKCLAENINTDLAEKAEKMLKQLKNQRKEKTNCKYSG